MATSKIYLGGQELASYDSSTTTTTVDNVTIGSGAAFPAGHIINVQSFVITGTTVDNTTTTYATVLTGTITPASGNKILAVCSGIARVYGNDATTEPIHNIQLYDSTNSVVLRMTWRKDSMGSAAWSDDSFMIQYLWTPASSGEQTIVLRHMGTGGGSYLIWGQNGANNIGAVLTLYEVQG